MNPEIALQTAINILRDSVECGRMPSGVPLPPDSSSLHAQAADELEDLLQTIVSSPASARRDR